MGGDELYRGLFEHAGVPLLVLAREGRAVVDANQRALDWLGVAGEAIRGRTLDELGIGELPSMRGDTTVTLRLHGTDVITRVRIAAVDAHVLVTVLDARESGGMESEERLQQVIDTLHEGIILVEETGTVLYFNPCAKEHYGFEGSDDEWRLALAEGDTFETRTLDGVLVPIEQRPSARLRRGERVAGDELWVTRAATGARRALAYFGARLEQPDGHHIAVVAFSDITARVESTLALRELNDTLELRVTERTKQLEAANRELEAFTYTVSHDLRAPVRAITSFSQIVVDEHSASLSEEARGLLLRVRNGGRRLGELVDDLLAFSQLGRHALKLRVVDVDGLVRALVAQLVGGATNVDLELRTLGTCLADASLLEQVWTNLIDNALKYASPRERIQIMISRHDTPTDAMFSVRDNGVGFDMRHADKLFGVFQRLHTSDAFEGTGVGLANVRRIVERHGGRVSARSAVDAGSTFEFSLPLRRG
ncbi:MAG: ATP-binding protein [Kofleriaceae bacterium]